ncbi:hypothetical protein [Aminobacter sp. AP02]|uniref:hypothetical protein n=1 Tax=Aminobacter sp. AP02 TaxID=2135737 RepID=UPI000D6D9ABF|nr:hypothetical protein [Aminobacter sp. AP02]
MTRAKRLYGEEKTAATRASFERKIEEMSATLKCWQKNKARGEQFWPVSLMKLAAWEDIPKGIFRWKSNNITKRDGLYGDLVASYWKLQQHAKPFLGRVARPNSTQALKRHNQALIQQNTELIWSVMELRDALVRADPKNEALSRVTFP